MHMENKVNILGILGIIGAILLIVCVFLPWMDFTASSSLFGESYTETISGWDAYHDIGSEMSYSYAPLVALICGIISVISMILPVAMNVPKVNKIFGIIALILAIVSIVLMILFKGEISTDLIDLGQIGSVTVSAGYGLWMGVVGAVLIIIAGLYDIIRKPSNA